MFWSARLTASASGALPCSWSVQIEDGDEHSEGSGPSMSAPRARTPVVTPERVVGGLHPVEVVTSSRPPRQRLQSVKPHDAFIPRQRPALQETLDLFVADELRRYSSWSLPASARRRHRLRCHPSLPTSLDWNQSELWRARFCGQIERVPSEMVVEEMRSARCGSRMARERLPAV